MLENYPELGDAVEKYNEKMLSLPGYENIKEIVNDNMVFMWYDSEFYKKLKDIVFKKKIFRVKYKNVKL